MFILNRYLCKIVFKFLMNFFFFNKNIKKIILIIILFNLIKKLIFNKYFYKEKMSGKDAIS